MKFKNLFFQYNKKKERLKYKKELLNFFGKHLFQWDDLFSYINKNLDIDLKLLEIYQEYTHLSGKSNPDIAYKRIIKPKENEITLMLIKNLIQFPIDWNKIKKTTITEIKLILNNETYLLIIKELNKQWYYYPKLYQNIKTKDKTLIETINNIYYQLLNNAVNSDGFINNKIATKRFFFTLDKLILLFLTPYTFMATLVVIEYGSLGHFSINKMIPNNFLELFLYIAYGIMFVILIFYLIYEQFDLFKQYLNKQYIINSIYYEINKNFDDVFVEKLSSINKIIPINHIDYQTLSCSNIQKILLNILNLSKRNPSINFNFKINKKDNIEHELLNIQHQMETEIKRQIMV